MSSWHCCRVYQFLLWLLQMNLTGLGMEDPDAGVTEYEYDALGRETKRTDGRGVVFLTNYDYLGRVTSVSASNSEKTEVNGISTTTHKLFWNEQRASHNAYYYFNKYHGVDINVFKEYLPYDQPKK